MNQQDLNVVRINVEEMTAEAFWPYGELLAARDRPADFIGVNSAGWRSGFESGSPAEVMFYRSSYSGMRFTMLERHHDVTQSFVPLGGMPALIAVAAATARDVVPAPEDVRAFLLDGTAGYVLHAGTWHALDRFPISQTPADVVIITGRATQHELESKPQGPWNRTEAVDYSERFGVLFEFEL